MFSRKFVVLALLAGTSSAAFGAASAGSLEQPQAAAAARSWPHQGSDLQPDPAARFGVLPNGMRYIIYRNATPPGQVAVRFRIAAGDLMETDEQNGLAHFIEHMAFNGTTNIPEGEYVRILERQGLAFGRDTNAFTAPDQTVYELNIPAANGEKVDTALMIMREVAGEIQFGAAAIDRERGIIQSEDRSMYAPARRASVMRDQFLLRDQLISRRLDIGNLDVIRTAPRERFLDYYRAYYRPERATLVVVGDVDPADVEAKIRSRFESWRNAAPAGAEPEQGRPAARRFEAGSAVLEGALRDVSISYLRPYVNAPDSRAERIKSLREGLALAVLNRRLRRISESGDAPFTNASAFNFDRYRSAEHTMVRAEPKPGRYDAATSVLEQEIRRLVEHGILDAELQREIVDTRTALQTAVAGAATRPTTQLASQFIGALNADLAILSPAQGLALFEEAVRGFDGQTAHQMARRLLTGSEPLLFATSPDAIPGGHERLAQAYTQARTAAVTAPVATAAATWPYTNFGTAGRVAEREEIADLGATQVRFANGVTMIVKPTEFEQGRVIVSARIGGGRLGMRPELVTMPLVQGGSPQTQGGFVAGGLAQLNAEQIREALAGKITSTNFGVADDALILSGVTRPEDFATQLQLLAAYVAHPGWRSDGFVRARGELGNLIGAIESMPMNSTLARSGRLLRSGDARWGLPTRAEVAGAELAPLRAAVDPMLRSAPLELIVVGNISVDEAIRQASNTFGALPQREAQAPRLPGAERIAFTRASEMARLRHSGRPDVAFGMIAWPTDDFYDSPADARTVQLLRSVMQLRGIDKLREELGATYSPVVLNETSEIFDEFGFVMMGAEVNPAQLPQLLEAVTEVSEDLKTREVTADELARAREPILTALANERNTNGFWLGRLSGATWDPRRLETIRTTEAGLRAITPADIRRIAQRYLDPARAYRLAVEPPATPPAG